MEITINDHIYRIGKLNAFQQLAVSRRLAPCLGKLAGLTGADVRVDFDEEGNPVNFDGDLSGVLGPLGDALGALSDEDMRTICNLCLEVTERKQSGGGWAPLRANGTTMFELVLPELLTVVWHVLEGSVRDFFSALPSGVLLDRVKKHMPTLRG